MKWLILLLICGAIAVSLAVAAPRSSAQSPSELIDKIDNKEDFEAFVNAQILRIRDEINKINKEAEEAKKKGKELHPGRSMKRDVLVATEEKLKSALGWPEEQLDLAKEIAKKALTDLNVVQLGARLVTLAAELLGYKGDIWVPNVGTLLKAARIVAKLRNLDKAVTAIENAQKLFEEWKKITDTVEKANKLKELKEALKKACPYLGDPPRIETAYDPPGDFFKYSAGAPAVGVDYADIRQGSVRIDRTPPAAIILTVEVYGSIPASPADHFDSWRFLVDLYGRESAGYPGELAPVAVFPALGVDLWVDYVFDGVEFRGATYLGPVDIEAATEAATPPDVTLNPDRTVVAMRIPIEPVEQYLWDTYSVEYTIEEENVVWAAVTNHCATAADCQDPPSDFVPEELYCPGPCTSIVGGTSELVVGGPDSAASPAGGSGPSVPYGALAGGAAAALAAVLAGGWYARRRLS